MSEQRSSDFETAYEEATRRTENQLRDAIDTIPAIVWSTAPDGSADFLNPRWLEYTGLSLDDAVGRGWEFIARANLGVLLLHASKKGNMHAGNTAGKEQGPFT